MRETIKFKETNVMMDPKQLLKVVNTEIAGIIEVDLDSNELRNLIYSIEDIGQTEPVLVYKGMLVDGRHRCHACARLGIKVKANIIDDTESEILVKKYITSKELQNKQLSTTQKAIMAYERFVIQEKYSLAKAAKEANIRRKNLSNYKYITENSYAIEHDYIKTLKSGSAVKLPNGKYSSSLQTIKNALMAYEEELSNRTNNNNDKEEPTKTIDYERIFSEYDIEDKISEPFWDMKSNFNITSLDGSIYLIWCLLRATYSDKYDFDNDLTIDKLTKLATL